MAAAQRKEPLGEGRPQSWRAGTKGTRDKGTGKGRLLSPWRKELPIQSKVSLAHAHPWQETRHHARRFQRRLRGSPRPPQLDPGSPSGPCCPSRSPPQPLIGHPSPAPLHQPEERQRIIYLEKSLQVSASDRQGTCCPGEAGHSQHPGRPLKLYFSFLKTPALSSRGWEGDSAHRRVGEASPSSWPGVGDSSGPSVSISVGFWSGFSKGETGAHHDLHPQGEPGLSTQE